MLIENKDFNSKFYWNYTFHTDVDNGGADGGGPSEVCHEPGDAVDPDIVDPVASDTPEGCVAVDDTSDDEPGDAVDETGAEEASVEPNRDVAVDDTSDEKPGDAVDPAPGDAEDGCDSDVCETGTLDNGFWVMPRDVVVAPFPDETLL